MRFKGLDLNLLVALDALLEEKSVTQAAARLHLTQSALSCALRRLRETLNDELLVQSGRKMVRTPFADSLRGQVHQILTLVDSTIRSNPGFEPETSQRHFKIAASDFVNEVVMVRAQRVVHHAAPGISLDLLPVLTSEVFEKVRHGEIDLVIAPREHCPAGISQAELFRDRWTCLAWSGNEAVGDTISLEQYIAMDHVILQPYGPEVALDQRFLNEQNLRRRVKVTAQVFTLIPRLLVGTNRIATVPGRLREVCGHVASLKTLHPQFEIPILVEAMQWHPSRNSDAALAWLRQVIRDVANDSGAANA